MTGKALFSRFLSASLTVAPLCGAPVLSPALSGVPGGDTDQVPRRLSLTEAVQLSLSYSPALKAAAAAVRAAEGREHQAGVRPNPDLEAGVDDVGLNGDDRGLDAAVYRIEAAQRFEVGGKRVRRRDAAAAATKLSKCDLNAARLDLVADVTRRFADLLVAQERVRVVAAAYEVGGRIRDAAAERVRSGKVSPLELTKADVELAARRLQLRRAEGRLTTARTALAALLGINPEDAENVRARGDLRRVPELPGLALLQAALSRAPDMARREAGTRHAEAVVSREKAARVPDVTLAATFAHEREEGNEVVELAVAVPLPLFDRNEGNIAAARAELDSARHTQRAVEIALQADLLRRWQEFQVAVDEVRAVETGMLPGARKAFEAAQQAYRRGKVEYLDVLDAQQTLFETEVQWLESLSDLHRTVARIERLTGMTLSQLDSRQASDGTEDGVEER